MTEISSKITFCKDCFWIIKIKSFDDMRKTYPILRPKHLHFGSVDGKK
jgi:hypothetical protein